nr:DUF6701 domain-containing protein [uncultured Pseudomonas sp.]
MSLIGLMLVLLASLCSPQLWAATCSSVFPASITGSSANQFDLSSVAWQNTPALGASNRSLGAGDHYFGGGGTFNDWTLAATGGASTRVFVNGSLSIANNSVLNAGGNPEDLILVVNGSLSLGNNVVINGFVYVTGSIGFGNNLQLDGAITAAGSTNSPGGSTSLNYNDAAIDLAGFGGLCSPATELRLSWSLDESAWTGAADEVVDSSGNALNGTVFNGADTADSAPALPAQNSLGTCAYGTFNSAANQYVQHVHNSLLTLQDSFTIGLWVKPSTLPASGLMSILSKDENYEFHLKPNGTVNWWWQTTGPNATREFDSNVALTPGQWSHVLIRFAPNDQRIYINGSLAGQASFSGTPLANSDPLQLATDQNFSGRYFNGQLDELRIYSGALSEAAISALASERHQCELALQCFNDDFARTSLGSDWAVASRGATTFTPTIDSARMRLTSNQGNVATSSTLQRLFPAAGNYIQLQFKHYAYNGSGADGIAVVLSDASITPQPGAFGGPLGYGTRGDAANPGFAGGWLGVGIDEYGNFSTEGGSPDDGPGQLNDSVAIRGSGSEATGYHYIAGTPANLNPAIDAAASTSAAPGHTYRITLDGRVDGQALVTVERDSGAGFVVLPNLDAVDVLASFGQAALPANLFLSLTGSTGGSTNIHELDDLQVCATTINPIAEQIDHFDFAYASPALTCSPQQVIVRACLNADCSSLYIDPVTVSLAPTGGWTASTPASVSGNVLSFSGGSAVLQLRNTTVGQVAVGALASTPTAKPNSQTTCSTANCLIDFLDSGFIFDVPTLLANKESADIGLFAVRKDDSTSACVPAFESGTRTLRFWSAYDDPNSGTRTVRVNGTPIAGSAPGSAVDLDFSAGARATIRVHYADAGLMTLNARYAPTAGDEAGLVMSGADQFVSKPAGLCVYSDSPNSDCAAGDAACSAFVAAGDGFRLGVRGASWEADGDADFCDNGSTPNYRQGDIALASSLVAPVGGAAAVLGTESLDIAAADAGEAILTSQSVSEVGVFTISATPAAGGYFAETVAAGISANLGRFYPASFDLVDPSLTPACGISTYAGLIAQPGPPVQAEKAGQGFAFSGSLSARNRAGAVTRNYTGDFAKLSGADIVYSDPGGMGIIAVSGSDLSAGSAGNGYFDYSANDAGFLLNTPRAPYDLAILTTATDSDGVTGSVLDSETSDFRLGQARIGNAHGSELQDLAVPFTAAYFTGSGYAPNPLDSCSDFAAVTLGTYQRSDSGSGVPTLGSGPYVALTGLGNYLLSAPGADSSGSLPLTYAAPAWLRFDWNGDGVLDDPSGLATFGIYRGAAPLIFRREVYGQ